MLCAAVVGSTQVTAPRWQPVDFEFRSSAAHDNPFKVRFGAVASGPDGAELRIPGFYDGGGVWKIRFAPTAVGDWSLVTSSEDRELDGRTAGPITCVPQTDPCIRGGLRVDPQHPRHFVREDGSRFFLMGYECDWLWALDSTRADLPVVNAYLDKLSAHGFNYVILNVYAHDTPWRAGHTEMRDYGPPPIYPWEGSNDAPRHELLDLRFWRHYDRIIDALHRRGMVAHIMTKVYNKMVNWPARRSPEEDLYYTTLIARYSAYPNVVWDFSKEAHGEGDFEYKSARIGFIRANDPYRRLITVHDDSAAYDRGAYDALLDYRSDQQHDSWHETILAQRKQREWPVVNVEFGYEWGPGGEGDHTYPVSQSPDEVIRRAWEVYMAGGYGAYYYTYTAWDIIHPQHTPPGYACFRNLRRFFEDIRYWLLEPADGLVSRGRCLADAGREYVVFQSEPCEFTLRIEGCESELRAEWMDAMSGEFVSGGTLSNGVHTLRVPESIKSLTALRLR